MSGLQKLKMPRGEGGCLLKLKLLKRAEELERGQLERLGLDRFKHAVFEYQKDMWSIYQKTKFLTTVDQIIQSTRERDEKLRRYYEHTRSQLIEEDYAERRERQLINNSEEYGEAMTRFDNHPKYEKALRRLGRRR